MNGDSIQIITQNYGNLTKNEQIVADYIMTHYTDAIGMSIHELARVSGVSVATPVRLAQHMGFDGYREFRLYLASHGPEHEDLILDIKQASNSVTDAVEKLLCSEIDSIRLTLNELDYEKCTAICGKIKNAEKILFFGLGTSYLVCSDVMHKFQRVGKTSHCCDDASMAAVLISTMGKNDIVIGISHSGETKNTCNILKLAKEQGIFTVAATTFPGSSICEWADIALYTQTRESPLHKIALTSRISQLATMDALFMTYFTSDYDKCKQTIDRVTKNLVNLAERE